MDSTIQHAYAAAILAHTTNAAAEEVRAIVDSWSRAGATDLRGIALDLAAVAQLDSGRAANLLAEIKPRLTVAEQQQLAREFAETVDARACSSPAQPSAGGASKPAGSSSNAANLALDLAQIALSIAGIFDPTPTCDTIDGVISLLRGDYVGAGISALSMIPYLGDAAKLGKLSKFAETVGMAVDLAKSNVQFGERIAPALRRIDDVLGKAHTDMLPAAANQAIKAMRDKLAEVASIVKLPAGTPRPSYRGLGAAHEPPDVLPNFSRAGVFRDELPVTLGYSQHIARGELTACATGACATAVSILERGHSFPDRIPQLFYEVDAQLAAVRSKKRILETGCGNFHPTIGDLTEVLQRRGFNAVLQNRATLDDLLNASQRGPVVFAVRTEGALDHALVLHSVEIRRNGASEYLYRLFNPDEFSPLASGLYDACEIARALSGKLANYMVTTR